MSSLASRLEWLNRLRPGRRGMAIAMVAVLVIAGTIAALVLFRGFRAPPSIFDAPAQDVAGYLASRDFSALSIDERLKFISGLVERFRSMSQTDSAIVAAFFAGLTGTMKEQLRDNVRILGKDILVQGAGEYLSFKSEAERAAFLDEWLVKWARFGQQLGRGKPAESGAKGDAEILSRTRRDARRDVERGINFDENMAQQIIDFWESDIGKVTTPTEQGQVFKFLPAIREHLLKPPSS